MCLHFGDLAVKENFNHYINQMGLDNIKHHSWASPFDFKKQAMLYLPEGLPDPRGERIYRAGDRCGNTCD